jgi:hypothetical protein
MRVKQENHFRLEAMRNIAIKPPQTIPKINIIKINAVVSI